MRSQSKGSGMGSVAIFLIALVIGAIMALLLAPQSGDELRKKLAEQGELLKQRYHEAVNEGLAASQSAQSEVLESMKK
jgi:gas vesicle protein